MNVCLKSLNLVIDTEVALILSIYDEPLVSHGVRGVNRWPVPWEGLALRQDISHSFGYSIIIPSVI